MTKNWNALLLLATALLFVQPADAQFKFLKKKAPAPAEKPAPPKKKEKIKPYTEVITKDAKSDSGLFTVHQIDEDYFYEIPDELFGREMLMVSRISKTADGIGFGGGKINTQVLRWEKRPTKVLLRVASYTNIAADSLPINEAVVNSDFELAFSRGFFLVYPYQKFNNALACIEKPKTVLCCVIKKDEDTS